jgi:hypothetical protein
MAGLVPPAGRSFLQRDGPDAFGAGPAIHVLFFRKTWMRGPSPRVTGERRHLGSISDHAKSKSPMRAILAWGFTLTREAGLRKRRPSSAHQSGDHRDREQHNRHEEHDLGRFDGDAGDHAEAKQRCDQRNNQKRDCPTHMRFSSPIAAREPRVGQRHLFRFGSSCQAFVIQPTHYSFPRTLRSRATENQRESMRSAATKFVHSRASGIQSRLQLAKEPPGSPLSRGRTECVFEASSQPFSTIGNRFNVAQVHPAGFSGTTQQRSDKRSGARRREMQRSKSCQAAPNPD